MALSISNIGLLALTALLPLYYAFIKLRARARLQSLAVSNGCEPPPWYPSRIPFGISTLMEMTESIKQKNFREYMLERTRKYGYTYNARVLDIVALHTSEPENMKAIFSTNADSFLVDDARVEAFVDFVGPGIFSSNGEAWQHHRALVRPSFVRANVEDTRPLEEHVRNLLISVPPNGTTFDLQVLFFRYTIDYSTDILFSASSKDDSVARDRFVEAFDYATKYATKRLMLGKLRTCLPDPQYADSKRVMREYTAKYVRRALEKPGSDDRYSFVREMAKETQDEDALRSELCNILLAARDTTASLLSNLFHVLARRPDVVAKLRVEVDSLRGKLPSASELKKLKYLQDTLAESLRLHSVVPLNSRFTSKPTVLPRGGGPKGTSPIVLDKGDRVFTDLYSMNHRHDLFGPDADEFVPERWQRKELSGQLGWAFIPFSGGPRICLGQQMAMIEAGYVTARLLQEFVRIEPRDERPWQEDFNMIMGSGNGTKVAMWRKT